jgi:hypothetical protein
MTIPDVIFIFQQILNLVCEGDTDVPKHVAAVKSHTAVFVIYTFARFYEWTVHCRVHNSSLPVPPLGHVNQTMPSQAI